MNLSGKVRIPPHVMARQVGDEQVILDLASGKYFGLDPVGARIWQLLVDGKTLEEVCSVMVVEYQVGRSTVEHDLQALLEALVGHQLLAEDA